MKCAPLPHPINLSQCTCGLLMTVALAASGGADPAYATTIDETFENGSNQGGWNFPIYEPDGGNSGAYLRRRDYIPSIATTTTQPSVFTGDFRERQVISVGLDLISRTVWSRPLSLNPSPVQGFVPQRASLQWQLGLFLRSDNQTPDDPKDDWGAFFSGGTQVSETGAGWTSYDFEIPSQQTALPEGWKTKGLGINAPSEMDWYSLVSDVAGISFIRHQERKPGYYYTQPIYNHDLGIDNMRITSIPEPTSAWLLVIGTTIALIRSREPGCRFR